MSEFLLKVLPGIITAIFASYLAAKWSQRKDHAYVEIVDALYDLIQYCEIKQDNYGQNCWIFERKGNGV